MEAMSKIVSQTDVPNSSSSVKESVADSSSKEKKILPGRRQQRHSTEIGSEYHRWWVVRNALGFETNEHIAGLLLDGFHALLQQLVHMCGGEDYQPYLPSQSKSQNEASDGFDDLVPSLSPTSSSTSAFSSSPPGVIEDIEEFTEYKNAITHYCDSLWRLCGLQDNGLQEVEKASHPVQEFLVKLMGYLRAAKGKSYNLSHKKKRFKNTTQTQTKKGGGENDTSEIGTNVYPPTGATVDDMFLCPISTSSLTLVPTSNNSVQRETSNQDQEWIHGQLAPSPKSGKYSFIPITKADKQTFSSGGEQVPENSFVSEYCSPYSQIDHICNTETTHGSLNQMIKKKSGQLNVPEGKIGFQQLRQKPSATNDNFKITSSNSSPSQRQYEFQKDGNPKTSSQFQMLQDECTNSLTDVLKSGQAPNHNGRPQQQCSKQSDIQTETCFQDIQCDVMKAELKQAPCKSHKRSASPDSSWNTANEKQSFADEKLSFRDHTAEELDESLNAENCVSNADVEASYEEEYLRLLLNQPSIISQPLVSDDQAMPQFDESQSSQQMTYNKCLGLETTLHKLETRAESVDKPKAVVTERYSGVIKPNVDTKRKELKENESEDPNLANRPLVNLFNAQSDNPSLPQKKKLANIKKNKSKSLLETTSSSKCPVSEACVVSTGEVNDSRNSSQNRVHPRQKIALMVNDSKHQSGANSVSKEQPLAIQPALCPNLDKPHGISAPFGTPVIFYPANSFSSTDNSLASLSSLVQNIVYNSHGTILKPLIPMTSLASNATYNSQGISNTPASSDLGNLRRSVAAALPVLSSHLNAGKTTLVPFYISHMNTLSNLSKSANLPTATGLTHVKVAPQNKVLGSSSTRLYQDWSCANSRLTLSSDTSDWRTQLKISDVRSCSDTDFTNVSTGKNDITLLNGNDQAQLFMKQYECTPVSSCLSSIPSPGFEFVNSWMHSSRHRESNNHLTMSNSETSCHPSPSTYISSTYTAPPSNPLNYPNTSTQQPGIPGNIKSHFKVTTKPQKKILTSLLANKASDYSSSRENIYSNNRSVDQNMTENSLQSLATSTLPTSTSTAPNKMSAAHTRTSSESLNVKKKRSRRLLCSVCDLLFYSGTDLLVHRYEQHSHVCGECDGRFLSASRLKQHKESDHPSMMLCSHCRFHTFSKQGLAEHEWSKHGWKIDSKVEKSSELSKSSEANSSIIEKELNIKTNECIELSINSTMQMICQQSSPEESNKHKNNMEQMIFSQSNNKQQSKFNQSNSNVINTALVIQTPAINDNLEKNSSPALRGTLGHDSLIALPHCTSESASYSSSFIPSAVCDTGPPVFPSFNREVIVKAGKDLASISAMYTQVSEHCRLDSTEIIHAPDHHFSETDEPRLVIDTEFCGSGKEDGTEGEIGKTDRGQSELNPHSDQPLCLVTHNRKVCRQPKKRSQTKRDVMKRKPLLSNSCHLKVSQILEPSSSEQNERELRNSRKCNLENLNNGTQQNGKTIAMSEESSFLFTTGEIVNLPVIEDQKDKLVMKISLKEPERLAVDCKSLRKKRKKRKKETSKIDQVIYAESLESVAQQEEILKLSGSEKDNLNPFSSNATVSNINYARFDMNTETENTIGEMHKTQLNVEQDVHKLEIVNNPLNNIVNVENSLPKVLEVVKPELLATNFPAKQEKLLSLRDRHIMSSLPPKKRRLRRSSRCSKDETDKLTETVNQNLIENETREDSISQSLSKNVIKVSLTNTRNSERRFKNVIKPTRFSGRCTRLSQFDKISPTIDIGRSRRNLVSTQLQGGSTSVSFISHRYACPIDHCEATFSRKWNLDGHIGKVHSKLSNVSCSVPGCMQKFGSRKDQRQHITMDHKGKTRKYKCSWPDCNKGFFARTHLRIHNLTHTGEKPVACDICDYRCRQRTALIWHMRKHGIFQNDIKVSNTNSGNQMA